MTTISLNRGVGRRKTFPWILKIGKGRKNQEGNKGKRKEVMNKGKRGKGKGKGERKERKRIGREKREKGEKEKFKNLMKLDLNEIKWNV